MAMTINRYAQHTTGSPTAAEPLPGINAVAENPVSSGMAASLPSSRIDERLKSAWQTKKSTDGPANLRYESDFS
jgi:hypothetical protein